VGGVYLHAVAAAQVLAERVVAVKGALPRSRLAGRSGSSSRALRPVTMDSRAVPARAGAESPPRSSSSCWARRTDCPDPHWSSFSTPPHAVGPAYSISCIGVGACAGALGRAPVAGVAYAHRRCCTAPRRRCGPASWPTTPRRSIRETALEDIVGGNEKRPIGEFRTSPIFPT
jgi:hypothetical protein